MYKAFGIGLISLSLGIFSYKTVERKKQCLLNLKEFRRALKILENELSFSMSEISFICTKISDMTSGEISDLFKRIMKALKDNSSTDFFTAYKSAASQKLLFSKEVAKEVLNFCECFGKKTLDIELENIKRCQKHLEEAECEERKIYLKERKLIYTFTAAIGAVTVIIVI